MNVGIIGAGYIGAKRARVIRDLKKDKFVSVFDVSPERSLALAKEYGASVASSSEEIFKNKKIDTVIIATINSAAAGLCLEAIRNKKNVLCEKPLGINYQEARQVYLAARKNKVVLKVGFNHRFHAAIKKAHDLVKSGAIGELMYMRAVYGHGARKGYDLEWRMNKKLSGGGELLDQGVHMLDLFRWFLGEFKEGAAFCENMFWNKSKLEDNAFCTLRAKSGQVAQMHVSATQWRNKFVIDVFGKKGYLNIEGKGGSYGQEKLIIGRRKKLGVRPVEQEFLYDVDISWQEEWKNFRQAIVSKTEPIGNGYDGMMANKLVEDLYASSKKKKIITF
ncbi:MAG TPA: Gfo/Idh/MocA family oxidoreductase [Candidatus Udaeobacter sp.]|nr:Gfo/Idh/MocA family oxidoreductase [Candidatus Udaeobacter sp.]